MIKRDISRADVAFIEERRNMLPGIHLSVRPTRDYIHGDLAPHLFGYLGVISEAQLEKAPPTYLFQRRLYRALWRGKNLRAKPAGRQGRQDSGSRRGGTPVKPYKADTLKKWGRPLPYHRLSNTGRRRRSVCREYGGGGGHRPKKMAIFWLSYQSPPSTRTLLLLALARQSGKNCLTTRITPCKTG